MAGLDWFCIAVVLLSLLLGFWRGLVYEVLSLLSWIAAFVLAQWLAPQAADLLPMGGAAEPLRYAAGFALVFIVALFTGGAVAWGVKRMVEAAGLRPVDRVLGAAFGGVRGAVLLLAVAVVVNMTPLKNMRWWSESASAGILITALKGLEPIWPGRFRHYLPA